MTLFSFSYLFKIKYQNFFFLMKIKRIKNYFQSSTAFHIKVVELEPKLTSLGDNIDETVCLQKDHDDMLKKLQVSKLQ